MLWLSEEMLDGEHQKVDIPAHVRTAYKGSCRKDWKRSLLNHPLCPLTDPSGQGTELT